MLLNGPARDVFILGAGFSRAVSDHMPLTDELGAEAVRRAGITDHPDLRQGRFETWLSRLAEPQPDLDEVRNSENRTTFVKLLEGIHATIAERQELALETQVYPWLEELVSSWHARQATLITFNYDCLVESVYDSCDLFDFEGQGTRLSGWHLTRGLPPFPPAGMYPTDTPRPTARLFKLHGSTNWYWVPGDATGSTLNSWRIKDDDPEERRRLLPGRDPFIVPPAALKSPYLTNPIIRELWRTAAEQLRAAETVFIVGYSLARTDIVASGMIGDALRGSDAAITIVNPGPNPIAQGLTDLLGRNDFVEVRSVDTAARDFVDETSRRLVSRLRAEANNLNREAPLLVGWSKELAGGALELRRTGASTLELACEVPNPTGPAPTRPREEPTVSVGDLLREAREGDLLNASYGDSRPIPVVRAHSHRTTTGPSTRWQVLVPARRIPAE